MDIKANLDVENVKDLPKRVPVILDYDFRTLVGSAVVQPNGTAQITLTDQRLVDLITRGAIDGVSIYIPPANEI